MRYLVLLTASVLIAAAPVASQAADPVSTRPNELIYRDIAGPAEVPNAPDGDDTMVCNYQHETGSLLVTRVCRTLRAWKKMQADSREFLEFQHLGSHQVDEQT